jgi:hypothetical protein
VVTRRRCDIYLDELSPNAVIVWHSFSLIERRRRPFRRLIVITTQAGSARSKADSLREATWSNRASPLKIDRLNPAGPGLP